VCVRDEAPASPSRVVRTFPIGKPLSGPGRERLDRCNGQGAYSHDPRVGRRRPHGASSRSTHHRHVEGELERPHAHALLL
jgi:hypothetical protein